MAVMRIVHGRVVCPICRMRVDRPEASAIVVIVFYSGLHAIYRARHS